MSDHKPWYTDEAALDAGRAVLSVLGGSIDLTKGDVREQYGRAALDAIAPAIEQIRQEAYKAGYEDGGNDMYQLRSAPSEESDD